MMSPSALLGIVCVILTAILWIVTIVMGPTSASVGAAAALTAIVAVMSILTLRQR